MKNVYTSLILSFCIVQYVHAQPSVDEASRWVDSVYQAMSLEQRIGQLFMIRAHSDLGPAHVRAVKDQIIRYHVGGLCFFQGTPKGHAELINAYQVLSEVPLLVAIDAEWGPGMRFRDKAISFPRQLTLGAMRNNGLIYDMGRMIGSQLREIGIHVNFAPVVDVNNNPANPVIGDRSFGEDRYNVTAKAYQYIRGLEDAGVMACAKHFPGHGDTDVDSHYDLPVIHHSKRRLDSIEIFPFRALIDRGLNAIMVAHLHIPALDSTRHLPTTLSKPVIHDLLRKDLGFQGLIFTDALEMQGVTKHFAPGQIERMALEAGNDFLVLPENMHAAFDTLKRAFASEQLDPSILEDRVKRILRHKYQLGLTDVRDVVKPVGDPNRAMHAPAAFALKQHLLENALTVASNDCALIPVKALDGRRIATLMIGSSGKTAFQRRVDSYAKAEHFNLAKSELTRDHTRLIERLRRMDLIIVGITGMSKRATDEFGIHPAMHDLLYTLRARAEVIIVLFGTPYALQHFDDYSDVLVAYEDDALAQDVAAQGIFGAFAMHGRLPVSASPFYPAGHGRDTPNLMRLGYGRPESVGMSSDSLNKIAGIFRELIRDRAAPGGQVLVARRGKIVYEQAFGHFTYDGDRPVTTSDLYDLASVTKIAASTLALMHLAGNDAFDPDAEISRYLTDVTGTNKARLNGRSILTHQSGLQAWIPFYEKTVSVTRSASTPMEKYYRRAADTEFSLPVAHELFLRRTYADTIWQRIVHSELRVPGRYVYSDLGFYIFARLVEWQVGTSLDRYCEERFYRPMGLSRIGFNPLSRVAITEIVPSEEDSYFRNQRVQGYVHDMGAAMMGGVSGHAGLFSNAADLAVVMQMLMQGGYYGGRRYLSGEVVRMFTQRTMGSTRRGLGFDMKELDPYKRNLTSPLASDNTYGHTGFTGTCVWNDPDHELVYIFLSNRTYPSMRNNKLNRLGYREKVHTAIYRAIVE